ncbi:histidine kinase dimerization/phosphoacceptor domain -containing protein [Ekhidna sp.]|uniref:histidine kinase dimerization/phosphoacceptor domain -containing protein n=1 Tax=Ekhidna sp. TaxID=2608089 RepID=UPI003B59EF5E
MNSKWLPYDQTLDDHSKQEIGFLLKTFLFIIPLVAVILAIVNFSLGLPRIALIILTVPIFCLISLAALNKGLINISVITLIAILIAATTLSCTLGNGVHETGIIVLPVIVLFSSLIMNVRGVLITTIIVILCLAYIVFGEQYGLYPSRKVPSARWLDLVVVLTVTIIHIFVTHSFSSITRRNLNRAKTELSNQKKYKEEISTNLKEKSELLRLVHHRVKNNLLLINSLIELETYGKPKIKEELTEVTKSIHTIARAHDPLYHTEDYKQVAIKPYLEKLISSFVQSMGIKDLEVNLEDKLIFHEKAILLGIILQKIITDIEQEDLEKLQISLQSIKKNIILRVMLTNGNRIGDSQKGIIHALVKEMGGEFQVSPNEASIQVEA